MIVQSKDKQPFGFRPEYLPMNYEVDPNVTYEFPKLPSAPTEADEAVQPFTGHQALNESCVTGIRFDSGKTIDKKEPEAQLSFILVSNKIITERLAYSSTHFPTNSISDIFFYLIEFARV